MSKGLCGALLAAATNNIEGIGGLQVGAGRTYELASVDTWYWQGDRSLYAGGSRAVLSG